MINYVALSQIAKQEAEIEARYLWPESQPRRREKAAKELWLKYYCQMALPPKGKA